MHISILLKGAFIVSWRTAGVKGVKGSPLIAKRVKSCDTIHKV
jgi:hypothetical protein